jgi:glycosyltransferase involved in cell wall biosynthesis
LPVIVAGYRWKGWDMMISIVIPSYLGNYRHAAKDRDLKLIRAVTTAINQDHEDTEVIVIADGCKQTVEIIREEFGELMQQTSRLKLIEIEKQPMFSGNVRNAGIEAATGEVICYLDTDDCLDASHVSTIARNLSGDWVWFNDMVLKGKQFVERECRLKLGQCGTANIAHRRYLDARWMTLNKYGYDDWNFIQQLIRYEGRKIETPGYLVCHIPYKNGYDV